MSTLIASASNAAVNLASRSRTRNRNRPARSSTAMSRLRACWVTHSPHWVRRHPERMDLARGDLDHKQHVQTLAQHRVHGGQVHRQDAVGLRSEELPPRERRPDRCRVDTGAVQDGPDGAGPDLVAEPAELTVDAAVAPAR